MFGSPLTPRSGSRRGRPRAAGQRATGVLLLCLVGVASLASVARAQLLADTLVTTAIASQTYPGLSFPAGTLRAAEAPAPLVARVSDADAWTDWEAFTARGLGAALLPAHVRNLANRFALAGFFEASRSETRVGDEIHTRSEFAGPDGGRALLYVIRRGDDVAWLVARAR